MERTLFLPVENLVETRNIYHDIDEMIFRRVARIFSFRRRPLREIADALINNKNP